MADNDKRDDKRHGRDDRGKRGGDRPPKQERDIEKEMLEKAERPPASPSPSTVHRAPSAPAYQKPYRRYHIATKNSPLPVKPLARIFVERKDTCVNCGICVAACVYGVHERQPKAVDFTRVAEPRHENCVSCQRCVNECPKEALELHPHREFEKVGDAYYPPDSIETLLYEAESGRVPVSGQGYRGPFSGPGFDRIWTDMSEIVRPTRDGIHGRESIITEVELGRKPARLEFNDAGELTTAMPPAMRIPLPLFFTPPPFKAPDSLWPILLKAAAEAGTFAIIDLKDFRPEFATKACVLRLSPGQTPTPQVLRKMEMVELPYSQRAASEAERIKMFNDRLICSFFVPFDQEAPARILELARNGAEVIHVGFDNGARTREKTPRHLVDALRQLDDTLVKEGLRDQLSIIASGGIGKAEHVPKTILCGADAVGLRTAWAIALGLRHFDTDKGTHDVSELCLNEPDLAAQRLKNLLSSWRDQLLEVMGAMGMREVRRLQGESGRAMFSEDLEGEFQNLFGAKPKDFDPTYG